MLGDAVVKLPTGEIVKISTVKDIKFESGGALRVINYMDEQWFFSPNSFLYAKLNPPDTMPKE
jgi:hypothetical protein